MHEVPASLTALIGQPSFLQVSDGAIEAGAIRLFVAAVEDGASEYWRDDPAELVAPPALLSAWNRPLMWQPEGREPPEGLALHFLVKRELGLPRAVVVESESEVHAPMRPGMTVRSEQVLVGIGEPRSNRLGEGRNWTIRVDYRCGQTGELLGAETMRFFGYGAGEEA